MTTFETDRARKAKKAAPAPVSTKRRRLAEAFGPDFPPYSGMDAAPPETPGPDYGLVPADEIPDLDPGPGPSRPAGNDRSRSSRAAYQASIRSGASSGEWADPGPDAFGNASASPDAVMPAKSGTGPLGCSARGAAPLTTQRAPAQGWAAASPAQARSSAHSAWEPVPHISEADDLPEYDASSGDYPPDANGGSSGDYPPDGDGNGGFRDGPPDGGGNGGFRDGNGGTEAQYAPKEGQAEIVVTPSQTLAFSDGSAEDWRGRLFELAAGREDASDPAAHVLELSPSVRFWKSYAESFISSLCRLPEDMGPLQATPPSQEDRERRASGAPPMLGGEYLSAEALLTVWAALTAWTVQELKGMTVPEFLAARAPRWRRVGRVTFHLAENKHDDDRPFAFLATYVSSLTAEGRDRHQKLRCALSQHTTAQDKQALISLLSPVKSASESLPWVRELETTGGLFRSQLWTVPQAHRFLKDIPVLEEAGLTVRIPDWWRKKPEVRVKILVGQNKAPVFGLTSLLDWDVQLAVGDESLSPEEVRQLLSASDSGDLVFFKGRWVEANREQLAQALDFWSEARAAGESGITFLQAMRFLSGMPQAPDDTGPAGLPETGDWVKPEPGEALKAILNRLRSPEAVEPPPDLMAELRPYQLVGLSWLSLVTGLGLGACLADDMGLGKTIQVQALLLKDRADRLRAAGASALPFRTGGRGRDPKPQKVTAAALRAAMDAAASGAGGNGSAGTQARNAGRPASGRGGASPPAAEVTEISPDSFPPSLLVAPASLLANWKSEVQRFSPTLRLNIYHPSESPKDLISRWDSDPGSICRDCDLVVTSYALLARRIEIFEKLDFRMVILDEAQAIKNPATAQSRAVRKIRSQARLALTGTPIENRLLDLWSLFDFLNPGLLGSYTKFTEVVTQLERRKEDQYGPLRRLVAPYLLRRLKSDNRIIADLPDKAETSLYCHLTKEQAGLYSQVVETLQRALKAFDGGGSGGMKRRGLVLQTLMRLKQLINHPAHMTGDMDWDASRSGKFQRVFELARDMRERQDRLLVFTQYQEIIQPLMDHLEQAFGRPGLSLHGGTPVKARRALVERFQEPDGPPFFILSLKAGGTGLNLTAAGQVIHFDRWWNPAVEDQATDRAYRIGQKKNVLVHKCVTRGTLEERIDSLLHDKRQVAGEILSGGNEMNFAEMDDDELMDLVSLDIDRAVLSSYEGAPGSRRRAPSAASPVSPVSGPLPTAGP
ncbi:MAG: ATP-dependent helicase [Deltaproteobacteria bacterium]|jgi:non-specific serine/threonine protein kinase|nr:ATP-dependent helicase [Deltaproteobacteria bacterium]